MVALPGVNISEQRTTKWSKTIHMHIYIQTLKGLRRVSKGEGCRNPRNPLMLSRLHGGIFGARLHITLLILNICFSTNSHCHRKRCFINLTDPLDLFHLYLRVVFQLLRLPLVTLRLMLKRSDAITKFGHPSPPPFSPLHGSAFIKTIS